jgi:hypothetical protein
MDEITGSDVRVNMAVLSKQPPSFKGWKSFSSWCSIVRRDVPIFLGQKLMLR